MQARQASRSAVLHFITSSRYGYVTIVGWCGTPFSVCCYTVVEPAAGAAFYNATDYYDQIYKPLRACTPETAKDSKILKVTNLTTPVGVVDVFDSMTSTEATGWFESISESVKDMYNISLLADVLDDVVLNEVCLLAMCV